jgi:hypothetical protein
LYDNDYIKGIDVTVVNLNRTNEFVSKAAFAGMKKIGKYLDKAIKKNISKTDHSLKDLARMGHPYSKRRPRKIHSPEYVVHKQEGDLYDSFYSDTSRNQYGHDIAHVAGVNEAIAPHARWVIMGTAKMVGRDFLHGTLQDKKEKLWDMFIQHMGKKRTWAGLKIKDIR